MNFLMNRSPLPPRLGLRAGVLLAIGVMAAASSAVAAEGRTPGLARAVDAAWQRAVEARRAEGETGRAATGRRIARSFAADEPALSYSRIEGEWYGGSRAAEGRETEVTLSWPLWMPGQRGAALRAARADAGWADANLALTRLEVAGKVREAAWGIAVRQAELELVQARVGFMKKLAEDVDRRVGAGDLARSDALAARADLLESEAERADAQRELHAAQAEWRVLTGLEEMPDADEIENEAHIDVDKLVADAGTPPELAAAEQAVQRAEGQLSAVRRSLGTPPELAIGTRNEVRGPGLPGENSLTVELRVPLGLGARRSQLRAQAQTELDASQAELTLARSRQAAELEESKLAITLADQQLDSERQRRQLLGERSRLMQRAFAAGEIDLAELLRTLRTSTEADASYARRHAEHGLAHARLLQAIGTLP
jgi:cobalt-zinc-cadmium efflux system outer membrane protein